MTKDIFELSNHQSTPIKNDFHFPAEWKTHQACLLIWPYDSHEWRAKAEPVQKTFINLTNTLTEYEEVIVFVDPSEYEKAKKVLHPKIKLVQSENKISWARDHCPTFVINKSEDEIRAIIWKFNSWGFINPHKAKHPTITKQWLKDNKIKFYEAPLILEGGSFHIDGNGTCITTDECLMNLNRNKNLFSKTEVENLLHEYLNVKKVIWLKHGPIVQDITDGHIDGILTFCGNGKILLSWNDNPIKEQISNYETLKNSTDALNKPLEIIKINEPKSFILTKAIYDSFDPVMLEYMNYQINQELWFDYVNIYIGNKVVLVPQYEHDQVADLNAINIIKQQFPHHTVIGINTTEFALSGGNIHCMTQQIPKTTSK